MQALATSAIESWATQHREGATMSLDEDEIGQKEEEQPPKEEIPVPLYFDRYIASELRSLREQIVGLDRHIEERFVQVDRRFAEVDRRFVEVDRRFTDLKESVDKLFDKSDATLKWVIGLFSPVIIGILAIIVKMFFRP